jgi:L-threonylcarbamoyladenylate synthase
MTTTCSLDPESPDPDLLARAGACLRQGGLVAFPTETVYGLGAHALDEAAVGRLFAAKQRPANDPLIVHVSNVDAACRLAREVPPQLRLLADRFWPGPLTLVIPRAPVVPLVVTAGLETVGVRVPGHLVARALIDAAGVPVAAPSANLFSRPSPTCAAHVLADLEGRIDMVIDAGPTRVGIESTVLDVTGPVPAILRPGAVTIEMIREVLPEVTMAAPARLESPTAPLPSPGLMGRHYAPRAPLTLYEGAADQALARLLRDASAVLEAGESVGLVVADEDVARIPPRAGLTVQALGSSHDVVRAASRLYAVLRDLDAAGVDRILARGFPTGTGLGLALRDRLRRAATTLK